MNTKKVLSLLLLTSPLAVADTFGVTGAYEYGSLDANSIYQITSNGSTTKIADTEVVPNSLAYNTGAEVFYYGDHYGTNLYAYDVSSASTVLIADLTNHGMPSAYALSGGADFYNGTYYYSPEIPEITSDEIPQQAIDLYAVNFSADGLAIESHTQLNVELPDGWVSFGDFGDIAVDSSTGILYGSSTSVNANYGDEAYFWSVDLNESEKKVTVINKNTSENARAYQLAYDAIENTLFGNQYESGEYVVIDKETGSVSSTNAVEGSFFDLASGAAPDSVPEPSSTLLLGLAASAGLLRRKRD